MMIAVIVLSIASLVLLIALIIIVRNNKTLKQNIHETEVKTKTDIDALIEKHSREQAELESKCSSEIEALVEKHSKEKTELENKCSSEIEAAKNDCSRQIGEMRDEVSAAKIDCERQIRETRETIENRKDTLSKMSDKELNIAIMLALDGYSDRLNRLENYLDHKKIKETIQQVSAATIQSIKV